MEENKISEVSANADAQSNAGSQEEKIFSRDQLAKIVNAESAKAAQQARLEAEQKYQRDMEDINSKRRQQEQRNGEVSREVDTDAIYQKVQERFNKEQEMFNKEREEQRLRDQMTEVANNYLQKVAQGKAAYDDFDEVTKDFDPTAFPQLTFLLSGIDNAGEVLYDLSKNPLKLAGIDRLAEKNPRQAHTELLKLSKSISDNRQALADANNQNVAEPLDQIQSSRVSGSNGKMGIRDLRDQDWLRG